MGTKFAPPVTEDTQTSLTQGRDRSRDADLLALDELVKPKVEEWKAAAKPVPFVKNTDGEEQPNPFAVTMRLAVAKDEVAEFKQSMVRRSCLLFGTDPIWYENAPDAEGMVSVKWTFTDHMTDKQKEEAKKAAAAAEAKAAEGDGEQGDGEQGDGEQGDGEQAKPKPGPSRAKR